jgi:hypothetical protein
VDIGCGEGELLAVLCQPAPSLPPPGSDVLLSTSNSTLSAIDLSDIDLHPIRVDGLDISSYALASAIEDTSPASANALYTRWESLKVKIWHGGLEVFNPSFVNVECIVATEVYVYSILRSCAAEFTSFVFLLKYRTPPGNHPC